jgi:ubiquinone/menaquinone biosynthesis C-methylase UbiE
MGTGPGYLSREILLRTTAEIVGADINPAMLDIASKTLSGIPVDRWSLRIADVHRLPFLSGSFDLVVSYSCFHHWENPVAALKECKRVLAPNGRLVLFDTIRASNARTLESSPDM